MHIILEFREKVCSIRILDTKCLKMGGNSGRSRISKEIFYKNFSSGLIEREKKLNKNKMVAN